MAGAIDSRGGKWLFLSYYLNPRSTWGRETTVVMDGSSQQAEAVVSLVFIMARLPIIRVCMGNN